MLVFILTQVISLNPILIYTIVPNSDALGIGTEDMQTDNQGQTLFKLFLHPYHANFPALKLVP